ALPIYTGGVPGDCQENRYAPLTIRSFRAPVLAYNPRALRRARLPAPMGDRRAGRPGAVAGVSGARHIRLPGDAVAFARGPDRPRQDVALRCAGIPCRGTGRLPQQTAHAGGRISRQWDRLRGDGGAVRFGLGGLWNCTLRSVPDGPLMDD